MPMCRSTVAILLFAPGFRSLLVTSFSTARTTPSLHLIPIAVPPFSTALAAYSTCRPVKVSCQSSTRRRPRSGRYHTWKFLPSGEKTEFERSYPVPIDVWTVKRLAFPGSQGHLARPTNHGDQVVLRSVRRQRGNTLSTVGIETR